MEESTVDEDDVLLVSSDSDATDMLTYSILSGQVVAGALSTFKYSEYDSSLP